MTTAAAILDGAYQRSTRNDAGKLASDAELLAHLDRSYQRVWALVARARPEQFAGSTTVTLGGSPPSATLPNLIDILGVRTSAGVDVTVAPLTERARSYHLAPCVYQQGRSLISRSAAGDPTVGAVLTLALLDTPAALTATTSVLDTRWPARHEQLLVDYVALYLSTKDAGRSAGDHTKLAQEASVNAAALAAEFGLAPAAVAWLHAPVERASGDAA